MDEIESGIREVWPLPGFISLCNLQAVWTTHQDLYAQLQEIHLIPFNHSKLIDCSLVKWMKGVDN